MRRSRSLWRRSGTNRMISGVCGGIAKQLGVDATLVRMLFVLISALLVILPGIVAYGLATIFLAQEG
jgi:phage shock protein C